jgi:hypothetical protein
MTEYHLYYMDEVGRISHAASLDCENDAEAVSRANNVACAGHLEIWQGGRQVKKFEPRLNGVHFKGTLFRKLRNRFT